jgi:L-ascorbate metabolism protein UlaG (beta-lactamase superfamily)
MINITLRRKARQFGRIVRHSALTRRSGKSHKPIPVAESDLGVTFIGHSGFLLQVGGKNLLVDPNFARWLFVLKRLRHPGVRIKDLPPIDLVLITHAHFDHLHRPSLRAIARLNRHKYGTAPTIVVPHDVHDVVSDLGYRGVTELSWWQSWEHSELTVTHTPSQHWGARMLHDYHRGYGGYVISAGGYSIYHAGDTAYFKGFHEIGRRLEPQIALLPIGAYSPASFRNVHTSPGDAVQAFRDLNAHWMIPMHYGTFRLSHEPIDEPLQLLASEAQAAGIEEKVLVLEEGKTRTFTLPRQSNVRYKKPEHCGVPDLVPQENP